MSELSYGEKVARIVRAAVAKIAAKDAAVLLVTAGGANPLPKIRREVAAKLPADAEGRKVAEDGSTLYGVVDPIYYRAVGEAFPLVRASDAAALPADARRTAVVAAIRKRRDGRGRLARWDVIAASATVSLGRKVSRAEVVALFEDAKSKRPRTKDESYTGRGTREGAKATRTNPAAAVVADEG